MRQQRRFWSFQSVEWSRAVAKVHRELVAVYNRMLSHSNHHHHHPLNFVLPDLEVVKGDISVDFDISVPRQEQIRTVALYKHQSLSSLHQQVVQNLRESDHLLIVQGPKHDGVMQLSTSQAIDYIKKNIISTDKDSNNNSKTVWATANPNSESSIVSVQEKLEAGASGIIMQPFLSSNAVSTFQQYPVGGTANYVAGLPFPTTLRSLLFWQDLIGVDLSKDSLFRDHMRYFADNSSNDKSKCSLQWARCQLQMLKEVEQVNGVHYMPLYNTDALLSILQEECCLADDPFD